MCSGKNKILIFRVTAETLLETLRQKESERAEELKARDIAVLREYAKKNGELES